MKAIDICKAAIKKYGAKNQIMVFLGELAELAQALHVGEIEDIAEELADVRICLAQRCLIAGISPNFGITPQIKGSFDSLLSAAVDAEAKITQGRGTSLLHIYAIEQFTYNKIGELDIAEQVKDIQINKLKRLWRRINE